MEAFAVAQTLLTDARDELDGISRAHYLIALTSTVAGQATALVAARSAISAAEAQASWRWEFRVRPLEALIRGRWQTSREVDCRLRRNVPTVDSRTRRRIGAIASPIQ